MNSPGSDIFNCSRISRFITVVNDGFRQAHADRWRQPVVFALYTLVSSSGAVANLLVIVFLLKFPQLRNLPNYFILNLAVSDLLMCTTTAPLTLYTIHNIFWPFGDVACRVTASAQALNIFVSTFTIGAIGIHRYCLTKFPLKFANNYTGPIIGILVVWLVSASLAFPYGFVAATVGLTTVWINFTVWSIPSPEYQDFLLNNCSLPEPQICMEKSWDALPVSQRSYTLACFCIQYLIPLICLLFLYYKIGTKVRHRNRWRMRSLRTNDLEGRMAVLQGQWRTLLILTCLVLCFAFFWLPWNLYNTLANFEVIKFSMSGGFAFCHVVGMVSACINPIFYAALNENFKAVFANLRRNFWRRYGFRPVRPNSNTINNGYTRTLNTLNNSQTEFVTLRVASNGYTKINTVMAHV